MQFLSLQWYNTLMSLHGIGMIIGILLGVAGVINYLVPLLIGAQDMAFPRLNAFSYWIAVPGVVLLLSSLALGRVSTPVGPAIRRSRHAGRWARRCSSWACSRPGGLPSWAA